MVINCFVSTYTTLVVSLPTLLSYTELKQFSLIDIKELRLCTKNMYSLNKFKLYKMRQKIIILITVGIL